MTNPIAATGASGELVELPPLHPARALTATGVLAHFNAVGELTSPDIHVARTLGRLLGEDREPALLAAALTVRAVRSGSVCLTLSTLPKGPEDPQTSDWNVAPQAWPEVTWSAELESSPLVSSGESAAITPLRLDGDRLYLDRYWQEETQVLKELANRSKRRADVDESLLAESLDHYFADPAYSDQRAAANLVAHNLTAVVTGGPGTGKTTTVARLLGVLLDADPELRIALAAPTGKAAARMAEALQDVTTQESFPRHHRDRIGGLSAMTLHRLLGYLPGNRFRHNRSNPLPFDVVVVDETSMVSLTMMARLLEALRPAARLVLVGDADQLASVEAGAVLGDLVEGLRRHEPNPVAELTRSRRFGHGIATLAEAVREGEAGEARRLVYQRGDGPVGVAAIEDLRRLMLPDLVQMYHAAKDGDSVAAIALAEKHRLLCAHRDGPYGVSEWNRTVSGWLAEALGQHLGRWFPGKPMLVTKNDYGLGLFNGDTGVVVRRGDRLVAAIAAGSEIREFTLSRLSDVAEAYAMTVHRSQGSQFEHVYVLLPDASSRILTRELLYTAVTRAKDRVRIIGPEEVFAEGVRRHAVRASGLAERLGAVD